MNIRGQRIVGVLLLGVGLLLAGAMASQLIDSQANDATPDPSATMVIISLPSASDQPAPGSILPSPTLPGPTPSSAHAVTTRFVFDQFSIDLPVVSDQFDSTFPGNVNGYPLCDVAQYLSVFGQPGTPGSTYIYAHAQRGMFWPLLKASRVNNGQQMLGSIIDVYTSANLHYRYKVFEVRRHALDFSIAYEVPPGAQWLIVQTSEGPEGTIPKLQLGASLLDVTPVSAAEAQPQPVPRACPPPAS